MRECETSAKAPTRGNSPDLRKEPGALDAVLGLRFAHVQRRHAQVAVVRERDLDQPLQPRILHEVAPADLGGGRGIPVVAALVGRTAREIAGDGRSRPPVVRRHARAGGQQEDAEAAGELFHAVFSRESLRLTTT